MKILGSYAINNVLIKLLLPGNVRIGKKNIISLVSLKKAMALDYQVFRNIMVL